MTPVVGHRPGGPPRAPRATAREGGEEAVDILDELPPRKVGASRYAPFLAAARAHPGKFVRVDGPPGASVLHVRSGLDSTLRRKKLLGEFRAYQRQNKIYVVYHPREDPPREDHRQEPSPE